MSHCLYCYQPLPTGNPDVKTVDFHPRCSQRIFGHVTPPVLPYTLATLNELAEEIVRQHITVTGVQPKLSLELESSGSTSRLTLVGLWGRYILKPPYEKYPEMPENEDLTMHLAALFGIATVPHTLIRLQTGELAYLTRRIDRTDDGHKRAMEDCCQLAERLTADKYKGSMELVSRLIRQHSTQASLDLVALYELTLFCFLTGNADMHLKNFSLWRSDAKAITLTPAYDLLATRLLVPDDREEMALTLNGRKSRFLDADWIAFAHYLGLTDKQRSNVHQRFKKRIPSVYGWIERSFLANGSKQAYKQLVDERAHRLGLL